MKKIFVFIFPIVVFIVCFISLELNTFAYDSDFNFPTAGVTISISHDKLQQNSDYVSDYEMESIYPIVYVGESGGRAYPYTPLAYGRYRSRSYLANDGTPGDWSNWSSINWYAETFTVNGQSQVLYRGNVGLSLNGYASTSKVIVFKTIQDAFNYFNDPENSDNLDNLTDEIGKDILLDSIIKDVDWGSNGLPYMEGSTPSQSIPAPRFTVSGGQSGNVAKTIQFYNFEYDSRSQEGRYGLVLYMKWASLDGFYLAHTGGMFADTFKVTYGSTLPWGDYVFVYDVPEKENQINYCPQSFSFDSNQACVTGFEHYLQNYPLSSRSIDGPTEFNSLTGVGPIESFTDYLSKPSCPYNTLIFSCYYYRQMPDGHFEYGPSSTGTFYPPAQNAIYNMNSKTSNDKGSMNAGYGGGASGVGDDPFNSGNNWNQQWGDNTPNIDYGQHADPQALVNNITDLFGLIGQMPSFMGQLFVFLPTWLINFISVCIALAIAIGVVKLFIG